MGLVVKLDMDGVILDLHKRWIDAYNDKYNDTLDPEKVDHWGIEKFVKPECGEKIFDLLGKPGLFLYSDPVEGSVDGVKSLIDAGHKVVVVTANANHLASIYTEKIAWLKKHMPFIDIRDVIIAFKKQYICGDVIIDDAPHNIENDKQCGISTVVFDAPYNKTVDADCRMCSWDQLDLLHEFLDTVLKQKQIKNKTSG